ncbi:TPA: DUF3173 family protein [Enterococcus faecalis]|nr:DUF3173 family protein [Enterococcus faecalis]
MEKRLVSKEDLIAIGYTKTYAAKLMRQARKRMVELGVEAYRNKRIRLVPAEIIEDILGFNIPL